MLSPGAQVGLVWSNQSEQRLAAALNRGEGASMSIFRPASCSRFIALFGTLFDILQGGLAESLALGGIGRQQADHGTPTLLVLDHLQAQPERREVR